MRSERKSSIGNMAILHDGLAGLGIRDDHYSGGSYSKSFHFIGRRKGSIRKITSPFWKMRTVPFDSLTATATAFVVRVIAAAAQCRAPQPFESVVFVGRAPIYRFAASTGPSGLK